MKFAEKMFERKEQKLRKKALKVYRKCLKAIESERQHLAPVIYVKLPKEDDFSLKNQHPIVFVGEKSFKLEDRLVGFQLVKLVKKEGFLVFLEEQDTLYNGSYFYYKCHYLLAQH